MNVGNKKSKMAGLLALVMGLVVMVGVVIVVACNSARSEKAASYAARNAFQDPRLAAAYDGRDRAAGPVGFGMAGSNSYTGGTTVTSGVVTANGGIVTYGGVIPSAGPAAATQPMGAAALQNVKKSEEVWVFGKTGTAHAAQGQSVDDRKTGNEEHLTPYAEQGMPLPGGGTLAASVEGKLVVVPLKHTEVSAEISGYIASVGVVQQFENPYSSKIEAVYVFPLPQDAGINEFVMTIGERHIRGIIREREEAKQIYEAAKSQGYVASLMTQERPNIFTQSVANIEPGKRIDISIRYFHALTYQDGWYEWVFPMVVGPRFNPPGFKDGVGAVAKGAHGASGQKTEVQYLRPEERSGHDIGLKVTVDAGVRVEDVTSVNHVIRRSGDGENRMMVELDAKDSIPNKDFVLRWKVAGKKLKSGMVVQKDKDGKGGYFALMLFPPEDMGSLPRKPLEMVFTVDVSGSQAGAPLAQEKAAVRYALTHMNAGDTFQVIRFGNTSIKKFPEPVAANEGNVTEALKWVDGFDANEGTMLVDALRASLIFPHDPERLRFVTFLTDGFIGNEGEALTEIRKDLGPSRIFSFGVGSSTNRYLLDHMAKMGSGAAAYLSLNEDANVVMAKFFERISHPALTDISLDFGTMKVTGMYPARMPDLFVGQPVVILGRYTGSAATEVHIKGRVGKENRDIALHLPEGAGNPALSAIWARQKIADLYDTAVTSPQDAKELEPEIRKTALEYGLMSAYTSFVAVDSSKKTDGDHGTTVAVPVPVPEGVRYDTTVQEGGGTR